MRSPSNSNSSNPKSVSFEAAAQKLAEALSHHTDAFAAALTGVESVADCRWYAQVLINRLLVIADLQAAGFLGEGDRWYLHTHFDEYQHSTPNTFFKKFLQPLGQQGFGLPALERPLPVQKLLGPVPFLGNRLFQPHLLEKRYPRLNLPDDPFEKFLGWFAEQIWIRSFSWDSEPHAITRTILAGAFEYLITQQTGKGWVTTPSVLSAIGDRTLDAYILQALAKNGAPPCNSVAECLQNLDDTTCALLVNQILPTLTFLDPACGSGRFLLMALERLQQIYQVCWEYAQTAKQANLTAWVRSLQSRKRPVLWNLTQQLLTMGLYGVDLSPAAVEITQVQLWLALLSTAHTTTELAPLPDLDFNITAGNALVGFIRVDEASFDKIVPKRQRPAPPQETILQGNLLQPLAAASYRDTLTEQQIRVEHYRAQTQAMAEASGIPEYVQAEFLRDRIATVNDTTQTKLDQLLLETFSQKLGIQAQEPQPTTGRMRKRLLTLKDLQALSPFHWGFFFNTPLAKHDGFHVIVTHPPSGTLRPHPDEFYRQQAALFLGYAVEKATFRRSHRAILHRFPSLMKLWSAYVGSIATFKAYLLRSEDYQFPRSTARSLPYASAFAQRCAALGSPDGVPPHLHTPK